MGAPQLAHRATHPRLSTPHTDPFYAIAMDVVSTSIGFVTNAITVIKFVRKTWKNIKDAPEQLQALHGRAADIEQLMDELRRIQLEGLFQSKEDQGLFERCDQAARRCLLSIDNFEMQVKRINAAGKMKVAKVT